MAVPAPKADDDWIGIHPGIERAVYESIHAVNFSSLKFMAKTPLHYREYQVHPPAPTPAKDIGAAAHCAILEPARFDTDFVAAPDCDRRTKDGKARWLAFEAEHGHQTIVTADEHASIRAWRDAVWNHPIAAAMLGGQGYCEVGVVWRHERTGLRCKALIDAMRTYDGWTYVIDLKTTRDASPRAFANDVARYSYHAQAAFYVDGCATLAPRDRRFAFICVEKDPPHAVAVFEADMAMLTAGEARYQRWLDVLAECRRTDTWAGYPNEVQRLELPRWAMAEEME